LTHYGVKVAWSVVVPEINARLFPMALIAFALGGCSADLSTFSVADLNPLKGSDPLRQSDYNYFYKRDAVAAGPVSATDLVGPDGRCAFEAAPTYAPGPAAPGAPPPSGAAAEPVAAAPSDPINPRSNQALYFTAGPETGRVASASPGALPPEVRSGPRGIALSMTECQVVAVAGYTNQVQIGSNGRGERTVTLTYLTGDRPGIYTFRSGRLVTMERVAEPQQPKKPQRAARTAKKQLAR
jgi:hypothetical protein